MNEEKFKGELLKDEKIFWTGQPDPSIHFTSGDLFLVPFSLLWGGFAIFWEIVAVSTVIITKGPATFIFPIFGIPFVFIGFYIMFGRFWLKIKRKKRTYYAVTNKRIIILYDDNNKIEATYLNTIPSLNKQINKKGYGSIVFGNSSGIISAICANSGLDFFVNFSMGGVLAPAFYDLKEVESVYQLINRLRNESA